MSGGGASAEPAAGVGERAPLAFSYAKSVAPMLWALVALGCGELLVVHLLVALLWSGTVAFVLSLLTLASLAWLVHLIRSMNRLPVLVCGEAVVMRAGALKSVTISRTDVAGVATEFPPGFSRRPGVLNLALLAYPNVGIKLCEPLVAKRRGARIAWIAHRLDDPAAFVTALAVR